MTPPRIAIIGAGGFCREHHRVAQLLESTAELSLLAACDPSPTVLAECDQAHNLTARGVRLFSDYLQMLDHCAANDCAFVAVPTPVPLHAAMHAAIRARNMAVYLEKPPTLDPDEFERMVALETHAGLLTEVGFNFIVHPARLAIKKRLLAGEFGPLQQVTLLGHWPRGTTYYNRASWAGKLVLNNRLVLDSCLTNAMAHYVHDLLFWAGTPTVLSWARPRAVTSIMAHGHAIPSADTVFLSANLDSHVNLRIAMSHAVGGKSFEQERARCTDALISFKPYGGSVYEIAWNDGRIERFDDDSDCLKLNYQAYLAYLKGIDPRPITTLHDSRAFVELCTMAFAAAAKIHAVHADPSGEERIIPNLLPLMENFIASGTFPTQIANTPVSPGTLHHHTNLTPLLHQLFTPD